MKWILLISWIAPNYSSVAMGYEMQEFESKAACIKAAEWLAARKAPAAKVETTCINKITAEM